MKFFEYTSKKARIALYTSWLSLLLFVGAALWHRFFHAPTPVALKLMGTAVGISMMSLVIGAVSLVSIWNEGHRGAGRATLALFLALSVMAVPLWSLPNLLKLPRLTDVSTDTASPPAYDRIAKIRQGQANPTRYNAGFASMQAAAYPDIAPLEVKRPIADVYSAVLDVVRGLKWTIKDEQAPDVTKAGRIEAEDKTFIFGFIDDVVIRVTGNAKASRVDVRSSSRFGQHDLGRNAERVRRFMAELKARLLQIDQGERMERVSRNVGDKEGRREAPREKQR